MRKHCPGRASDPGGGEIVKARFPAVLAAITLIAAACAGNPPSQSAAAPSAVASAAASSAAPSAAAGGETTLRVARFSDFLQSIHPVHLGTGNQELMADIVFS